MSFVLRLHNLKLPVRLGCSEEERSKPQWVEWSVECTWDSQPLACTSDRLQDAICYDQLSRRLAAVSEQKDYHLIEHLAVSGVEALLPLLSSVSEVCLRVHKLAPPIAYENKGTSFEIRKRLR